MMCSYQLPCLYEMIRTVMVKEQVPEAEAIRRVCAAIAENPQELKRWWEAMGELWLRETVEEVYDRYGGPHKLTPRCQNPAPLPKPAVERAPRRDWKTEVKPLDVKYPVGATGRIKRLGAWTQADMMEQCEYFHAKAKRLRDEGDRWAATAERMQEEETLEVALQRFTEEDRAVLPERLRVILPTPEETS
jgi:hypothetical protein